MLSGELLPQKAISTLEYSGLHTHIFQRLFITDSVSEYIILFNACRTFSYVSAFFTQALSGPLPVLYPRFSPISNPACQPFICSWHRQPQRAPGKSSSSRPCNQPLIILFYFILFYFSTLSVPRHTGLCSPAPLSTGLHLLTVKLYCSPNIQRQKTFSGNSSVRKRIKRVTD